MAKQAAAPDASQSEAQFLPRQPYAPPKATFVPLRLEERLAECQKLTAPSPCLSTTIS